MYGRQESVKQTLVEITDEGEYLEGLGVNGRKILKRMLKKWNGGTDKIRVRTLVRAVINIMVP
jgi:hypothetical protein